MDYSPPSSRDPKRSGPYRRTGLSFNPFPEKTKHKKREKIFKDTISGATGRLEMWKELYSERRSRFNIYAQEEKLILKKYRQDIKFLELQISTAKQRKMKRFHAPTFLKDKIPKEATDEP
jgi:hypothetical protein